MARDGTALLTAGAMGRPRAALGTAAPESGRSGAAQKFYPALLTIFFVSLLIPGNVSVAGMMLSPSRIVLLCAFVPMFLYWIGGRSGRVTAGDFGIMFYCLWVWIALFSVHGLGRFHSAGIQFVEMFGGYLIGRVLIRDSEDYHRFVRYMFCAVCFLFPFAVIELLTGWNPIRSLFQAVLSVDPRAVNRTPRMGFTERVQGPFAHAILFGLFCSIAVANIFYTYRDSFLRRTGRMGFVLVTTFMSLSSAPLISAGLQLLMIFWDRIFAFIRARWIMLVMIIGGVYGFFALIFDGGIMGFIFENLLFVPMTGYARVEIFTYGAQSVMDNLFFGIGFNDWVRAYWMTSSVDNFWLVTAMRSGLPALLLLWLGIGLNAFGIMTRGGLTPEEVRQRRGHLIALAGLMIVLATVHIWGPVSTFVLTYVGAGVWFYARPPAGSETLLERRLRRQQAAAEAAPAGGRPHPAPPKPASKPAMGSASTAHIARATGPVRAAASLSKKPVRASPGPRGRSGP